ncbi:protein unc-80 homolog [Caerostris extrusa]|uniref:Protein unc-80 homolog n=1 Tax=Caerostris extrusa TaxID=172846 RepID=A0AAV4PTD8_CAEEX|nr:protein unc-80 homolog [Caerostris extrusa]
MPKRRHDEDPEDLSIPQAIQSFLWTQTCPLFNQNLERSMKHHLGCKEKLARWRFVQAAFPHIMHCCAALLYRRKDTCIDKLGTLETKLLYTLQWIILDAAEECADAEAEKGIYHSSSSYLFHISSIQVFVYLFAPLGDFLKHSDFMTSFRLENGLKLWESLWEHKHPNVPCFTTHVMPKRTFLRGRRDGQNATKFGDVFIGGVPLSKQLSKDQCTTSVDSSETVPTVNSPASTGSENVKEESESNKSSSKEDFKKDPLFCDICSSHALKTKDDSNLLKCNCGNISIQKSSVSKTPETAEKNQRLNYPLVDRTGKETQSLSEGQGMAIISEPYCGSDFKSCLSSEHLEMQRPKSALAMLDHNHSESEDGDTTELIKAEMVRGRSMPSLHHYGEHKLESCAKSIITVTEHSPVASVQFFLNQDSGNGQRDDSSPPNTPNPNNQQFTITRSQTDSNIMYDSDGISEAKWVNILHHTRWRDLYGSCIKVKEVTLQCCCPKLCPNDEDWNQDSNANML